MTATGTDLHGTENLGADKAVRATDLAAARELATLAARLASGEAVRKLVRHGFPGVRAGRRWS